MMKEDPSFKMFVVIFKSYNIQQTTGKSKIEKLVI
jgi:hypothetical protein